MADITIIKIDENKSHEGSGNPYYVLDLSGEPDIDWVSNLESVIAENRNPRLVNVRVKGAELSLNTMHDVSPEQMLETVQGLLAKVNEKEDTFKNKLRELNKKLSTPTS